MIRFYVADRDNLGSIVASIRARADDAHIALEYIPQLRKFIDTGHPEEFTDRGNSRVIFNLEKRTLHFILLIKLSLLIICIDAH